MIPTLSTLLKTIAGKTILGVLVVTLGVGAAAAAGADDLVRSSPTEDEVADDEEDEDEDESGDDADDDDGDDGDDGDRDEPEDADDGDDADDDGDDADEDDADDDGDEPEDADDGDDADDDGDVPEWKIVKTEGRDWWHDLRDEQQAEWLEAKQRIF